MTKNLPIGTVNQKFTKDQQDFPDYLYCLKNKTEFKNYQGQRGKQKIPPSGHLAPTIQMKNGRFYPRLKHITEEERRARLHDKPEEVPQWFIWFYQWKEKDQDDLWKTRSKSLPSHLVHQVKYMIDTEKSVQEILTFVTQQSQLVTRK
jgi:hypothetical protein